MANNSKNALPVHPPKKILLAGTATSIALLALILWTYFSEPFSEILPPFWSAYIPYFLILIPALGAAIAGMLVLRQFSRDERPYAVWQAFAIGLWCWAAGEVSGLIDGAMYWDSEYPEFTLTDAFWLVGYFLFGLSLYYQVRLVYGTQHKTRRRFYLAIFALALLVAAGFTQLAENAGLGGGASWLALFVAVLYPVLDVAEGGTAIWLSFLFGRGLWVRPWWGLILFAIADSIDTFYWMGGYDLIPSFAQTIFDYLSITVYPASYMVAFLALLSNYFILRYGERSGLLHSSK
ncbi:MAG: hypothetical protein HYZ23_09650 [Chloroflexi bacterium]|nr:hypothetical protein [Chloroflexota bacterium]